MNASPRRILPVLVLLLEALSACGPGASGRAPNGSTSSGPDQITIAIAAEPRTLVPTIGGAGGDPSGHLFEVVHQSLVTHDSMGRPIPRVARSLPSVEAGTWRLLSDGTMETTWDLRDDVFWHDGQPLTATDVVFSWRVFNHSAIPVVSRRVARLVEFIDVLDPHRVVMRWAGPYAFANQLSAFELTLLPAHLLGATFELVPQQLAGHPYWQAAFVGLGPYRLSHWIAGSSLELDAVENYFLGAPHLNHISVRFTPDDNAAMAAALSGTVDLVLPRRASLGIVRAVREQWRDGREGTLLTISAENWVFLAPQFSNPEPTDLLEARVRQALALALDRSAIAEAIAGDASQAGELWVPPSDPSYPAGARTARHLMYNPNQALDLLGQVGWRREGTDNALVKHGRRFTLELVTTTEWHLSAALVADYWQQLGVDARENVVALGTVFDRQARATYAGVEVTAGPPGLALLDSRLRSSNAPGSENLFVGANRGHYASAEMDHLLDRTWATLEPRERAGAQGELNQLLTSDLPIVGLFFYPAMMLVRADVRGVQAPEVVAPAGPLLVSWNAHEWARIQR